MTFDLIYTDQAKHDLNVAVDSIAQQAPQTARHWFDGFITALETLKRDALVYGLAPESDHTSIPVRQFFYRTKSRWANRALYTIRDATVYILAIRRPGLDLLTEQELQQEIIQLD